VRGLAPPSGPQADHPQGMEEPHRGEEAARQGPSALSVDLPLRRLRTPETGEVHWLILPTAVNAEVFSLALENFAREVGAGKWKRIRLVIDGAGWHTAKRLRVPERIHIWSSYLRTHQSYNPRKGYGL
jgi:hypothetical protein